LARPIRCAVLFTPLVLVAFAVGRASAQRAGIRYDAMTHDSVEIFGLLPVAVDSSDSALVMIYRTFLPPGDTAGARREALPWWPWLAAQTTRGKYRKAAIQVIWPTAMDDSLFEHGVAARYTVLFTTDSLGCWHIANDTTPIQTCDPTWSRVSPPDSGSPPISH